MTVGELEQTLAGSFGVNVATCLHRGTPADAFLFPEEEALIANAVEKRRLEFATGRDCARKALAKLGVPSCPILAAPDRSPIWPAGFIGSISHTDWVCGAVAARSSDWKGLGFDIESATPLSDELMPLVCSAGDREHFATLAEFNALDWGKIAFCAKEAFYKCQYPLTHRVLDFRNLSVRLTGGPVSGTFCAQTEWNIEALPVISGFWLVHGAEIYAGCTC
jgi:4'-phosphopantetheinyl transferase EntD